MGLVNCTFTVRVQPLHSATDEQAGGLAAVDHCRQLRGTFGRRRVLGA